MDRDWCSDHMKGMYEQVNEGKKKTKVKNKDRIREQ